MKCPECGKQYLFDRFGVCKRCGFNFDTYYREHSGLAYDHKEDPSSLSSRLRTIPLLIWAFSIVAAAFRIYAFSAIHSHQTHDALWQFDYLPLWISDFPISIAYFILPIPFAEEFIGPIWWLILPVIIWLWFQKRKKAKNPDTSIN